VNACGGANASSGLGVSYVTLESGMDMTSGGDETDDATSL